MRITCPNCGAQYEVDDSLIPETGRDVQCSNCGKGWFQARGEDVADTTGDEAESVAPDAADELRIDAGEDMAEVREEAASAAPAAPVEEAAVAVERPEAAGTPPAPAPRAEPEDADDDVDDDGPGPAIPPPQIKHDESVMAVLREEAERELAQRRAEAATIETQPELGLPDGDGRRAAPAAVAAATAVNAGRRELLPDIDVINSTLRPDIERGPASNVEEVVVEERRRGFRLGFGLVMLLVAALIGLYLAAGWLAATVPALEPFLVSYVGWANGLRAWLDGLLAAGVEGLSALTPPPSET